MRIFAEVLPSSMGKAMYRINENLRKYAPSWVEFTKDKDNADFQILDIIGTGSFEYLYKDRYALLQHCFLTSESSSKDVWLPIFGKASLVATYMDLPRLLGDNSFNFYRMPWGADPEVFHKTQVNKFYSVLTTGHVSETESVNELYDSLRKTNGSIIHVGHNYKLGDRFHHKENISDASLTDLYNKSYYVSGLRKIEGFELPVVEGLLCGARGICYNSDHYSYWYKDFVEYIQEDDYSKIGSYSSFTERQLEELFSRPYRKVTDDEIERAKNIFSWEKIFTAYWKKLEESL